MMMMLIVIVYLTILINSIDMAIQRLPSISIKEQISIGTSIYELNRVYSSKESIRFSFLSDQSSHHGFFMIDSLTGRISIKRMIDREELCQRHVCHCDRCVLTLEIIGNSQTIDILSLDVIVENINDHRPTFPFSTFDLRLSENVDIGHIVSFPGATDLDDNEPLNYRLITFDTELVQTFSIVRLQTKSQLGLRVLTQLDRERRDLYRMIVEVTDGEHAGQMTLEVHILDSNDNVPIFEKEFYRIAVREDLPVGTEILHVHATDQDQGMNSLINYTIVTNLPSLSFPFQIDVTTGQLQLIQKLDYEQESHYQFSVRARDNGADATNVYSQVQVDVLDVNDCPPEIEFIFPDLQPSRETLNIDEEQSIGTRLFHISVSDKDSNTEQLKLKLLTHNDLFQLHQQYNDLYSLIIRNRLDREVQEEYQLIFQASDHNNESSLSTEKMLNLVLNDINDCPPMIDHYPKPIIVEENNPKNVRLIQLNGHDCDAENTSNSRLAFSLLPSEDSKHFQIDRQTGILSVGNISFDSRQQSIYHLILNVSDHGRIPRRLETLEELTIHIRTSLEFENRPYRFRLMENSSIGTLIGQVKFESNSTRFYELNDDMFQVDRVTGQLSSKTLFDFEKQTIYHLTIVAFDHFRRNSDEINVTIELIDVNDNAPIVDAPNSIYISDDWLTMNETNSIFVTQILASDRDQGANANLTFEILDGNKENQFKIDRWNGTITIDRTDFKTGNHRLIIHVCDQGESSIQCSIATIEIRIGDRFDRSTLNRTLAIYEPIVTRDIVLVIVISSFFTVLLLVSIAVGCAHVCKQKKSRQPSCQLSKKIISTKLNQENHHLQPTAGTLSSEDSCYGSHDLSRSSSNTQSAARPLLISQERSPTLSSSTVDETTASFMFETRIKSMPSDYLSTFHSSASTIKRNLQSFTRRPNSNLNSTYLTYDSIDTPPALPPMIDEFTVL